VRRFTTLSAAAAVALILPLAPAAAQPDPGPDPRPSLRGREAAGNGAERARSAAGVPRHATSGAVPKWDAARGYPRRTTLPVVPANPADRSIKLGLTPYHDIAPKLNALQRRSDRVSAEVIGESATGLDLYLVTVTAPESSAEARRQAKMRARIENAPAAAARDREIARGYKTPVFINANIHGNEWEGTDAALRVIEELATGNTAATKDLLAKSRLYFNITANPDGRIAGTRGNGNGFDMNRDFVTASQPEVRAMRQIMIDTQPVAMLDLHGYVNGTLIEPTTPPHGENYEYDLFIKNTYANGIGMEAAVKALGYTPGEDGDGVEPPQIPFRDAAEGWDDWPPIFTPQYAPFHGAVATHTIEIPLQVNNASYNNLPVAELRRRSAINTDIAATTVRSTFAFTLANRARLLADQIEVFRRGAAGEPLRPPPLGIVPGFGPEDVYTTTLPRAYVISPRPAVPAARLVDFLVANDVRVERATRGFRLGGVTYPRGSYVVDMHQPKRGMANVILAAGRDITPDVDQMYDISAWSHGLLWGTDVDAVTSGPLRVPGKPVLAAEPTGSVAGQGDLALRLDDGKEIIALNELLAAGVAVRWRGDGGVVVPGSARSLARTLADRYGVTFAAAGDDAPAGAPMRPVTIAAAAAADEVFTLRELGFDIRAVSTSVLNAGFDWSGVDVLFVSSGLDYASLDPSARTALDAFLVRGGVITRGATGAAFNSAAGLLTARTVPARDDANGVVRVAGSGGPLTAGTPEHAFVFSPLWFTDLGPEVTVEQSYANSGPLVSGHWRPDPADGTGGPAGAVGQASVIRGTDERGAAVVAFGTEPLFRNHPKGMFAQVGRAVHWTVSTAGAAAPAG
jgi:hypothetical protein